MNYQAILITTTLLMANFSSAWAAEDTHEDYLPKDTVMDGSSRSNAMPDTDRGMESESGQDMGHDMKDSLMSGMNHDGGALKNTQSMGGMNHGSMDGGETVPSDTRNPHAYSDGYDFRPLPRLHMGDQHNFGAFLADRFELANTSEETLTAYDVLAWYGRDFNRLWFKSEGEVDAGRLQQAHTELLWGRGLTAFWDAQVGVRYDSGVGPERGWLALGFQGLAPYWFDVEITAYVGDAGRTALHAKTEYELLFTQKLILQPRVEAEAYGKRDAKSGLDSGLSGLTAGIRLRYEITRQIAPYIGIEWTGAYGGTADYLRIAGRGADEGRVVAGLRFWF